MKTGTKFYQFTGKKILGLMDDYIKDKVKMTKEARKFSRKVGGHGKDYYISNDYAGSRVTGIIFKDLPDTKLWMTEKIINRKKKAFKCIPKQNSNAGKALYDEFRAIVRPSTKPMQKELGWKDIFFSTGNQGYMSAFNHFYIEGSGFSGFSVPMIDDEMPEGLSLKGCKEIKYSTYVKKMEGLEE